MFKVPGIQGRLGQFSLKYGHNFPPHSGCVVILRVLVTGMLLHLGHSVQSDTTQSTFSPEEKMNTIISITASAVVKTYHIFNTGRN